MANHLLAVTLLASVLLAACSAAATTPPANSSAVHAATTAYDVLEKNHFPRGLLPKGVLSYDIRSPDVWVEVRLARDCDFSVTVDGRVLPTLIFRKVGAVIKPGSITEIYGAGVQNPQITYEWLNINTVERAGVTLTFTAQGWTRSFPVRNFSVSPSCH